MTCLKIAITATVIALLHPLTAAAQVGGASPDPSQAPLILSRLDKDGDDRISQNEAPNQLKRNFAIVDRNSDGGIDASELKAVLAMAASQRDPDSTGGRKQSTTGLEVLTLGPSYGTVNTKQAMRMRSLSPDKDRPFYMLNLVKYRERAVYRDGRETKLTGRQANDLYSPIESLAKIGAEVAYVGAVDAQQEGSRPRWQTVAIVKYPSRAKFFEMTADRAFQDRAIHKDAGVEVTQVIVTERVPGDSPAKETRTRARETEGAFTLLQLVKYRDVAKYRSKSTEGQRSGREAMEIYENVAARILHEVGAEPVIKLSVEGVFVGDGRTWSECRLIRFPSQRAFHAATENTRLQKVLHHRSAAIADSYTLHLRTQIDRTAQFEESRSAAVK